MAKNLLLGAFDRYDYSQLQYWINSFKATGSDADIVVVVSNASRKTVEKLGQKGVAIIAFNQDFEGNFYNQNNIPIQTERFFHYWNFLKDKLDDYNYILHTDMKDVVFQHDPFEYLRDSTFGFPIDITATTECLRYKDEPWGRQNLIDTFGEFFYSNFQEWEILNVGVVGGNREYFADLCLNIFLNSINRPVAICEQAVYNQLMHTQGWLDICNMMPMYEGFCANLGTVLDPTKIEQFTPHLLEDPPLWNGDELTTTHGTPFAIVHQYDRVPQLKQYYEEKFSDA